jgi:TPR repeat protein
LLLEGRVVWGALVQANQDLFNPTGQLAGAPGEVLYDPSGRVPREDLAEMAGKIYSLKGQEFSDPATAHFSKYLADEMTRVFGLDVPSFILPYPLKVSSTWFQRAHLPGGAISDKLIPLLISDAHPGAALPLPAMFFPGAARPAQTPGPGGYLPDPELAHLEPASLAEEGMLWFMGAMIERDYGKARAAWEKAASRGNPAALYGLGMLHENGFGVGPDLERALEYYEQAEAKDYEAAAAAADRLRAQKRAAATESRGLLGRLFGKKS